jgi:hypothetical protein
VPRDILIEGSIRERFNKMPSSRDFFFDLFREQEKGPKSHNFLNMLGLMYEGTNWLITQSWGMDKNRDSFDPARWKGVNIEEVLTFVDIGSRMYPKGTQYRRGFEMARKALLDFISLMLFFRSNGQHCEHFGELLFDLTPTDTIISFNYDTIAEKSLEHYHMPQYKNYAKLMSGSIPKLRQYEEVGLLLKLHGSVNWVSCVNKKCKVYRIPLIPFKSKKRDLPTGLCGYDKCPVCNTKRPETVIVPPTTEKVLNRNEFIHKLWIIAKNQLPRFNRIVFIGYSFPPNDGYTEWLFRQLRFMNRKPPEIIVVNPEVCRPRNIVSHRYDSIFQGFSIHKYGTLKQYITKGGLKIRH